MTPGGGSLAHVDPGRVRYTAGGVEPWIRVQVRATSLEDPARHAEAVIEVLPNEIFGVLEQVLGPGWIETGAERPAMVRLEIKEPVGTASRGRAVGPGGIRRPFPGHCPIRSAGARARGGAGPDYSEHSRTSGLGR